MRVAALLPGYDVTIAFLEHVICESHLIKLRPQSSAHAGNFPANCLYITLFFCDSSFLLTHYLFSYILTSPSLISYFHFISLTYSPLSLASLVHLSCSSLLLSSPARLREREWKNRVREVSKVSKRGAQKRWAREASERSVSLSPLPYSISFPFSLSFFSFLLYCGIALFCGSGDITHLILCRRFFDDSSCVFSHKKKSW